MGDAEVYQTLSLHNAHWNGGPLSPLILKHATPRRPYHKLRTRIRRLPFEVLVGPRQVGKTTLIGHLMRALLDEGVPPNRVVYALLDLPQMKLELAGSLAPLLRAYERFVLRQPLAEQAEPVYLFLDEIHALPEWDVELKALYDAYHPVVRVLATGSSSAALSNARTGDFPGRVERVSIYPMKFSETLVAQAPRTAPLAEAARSIRSTVQWAEAGPTVKSALASAFTDLFVRAQPHLAALETAQDSYLLRGGYPAAQPPATDEEAFAFFEATLQTVLSLDLKLYPNVRKPGGFSSFLARMARSHGGKFVSASVAKDLGLDKETPAAWKAVAEDMFLVHQLPAVNRKFHPIARKADKAYIQDPGILHFLSSVRRLEDLATSGRIGLVAEGVLFDHMRRLQYNAHGHGRAVCGFLEEPEVDLVVAMPTVTLLMEAKYREDPREGVARMRSFAAARDTLPVVVTRRHFDVDSPVWALPLWTLLLSA